MKRVALALAAVAIVPLATAGARAETLAPPEPTPAAAPAAPAAVPATLADFAWLAGDWVERDEKSLSQEVWLAPAGDIMTGTWRLVVDGKAKVLELLALRQQADGVTFYLRHFDGAFVGWEDRATPIALAATAPEPGVAVFDGKGSDGKPLRITYRQRRGPGGAVAGYDGWLEHGEKRLEFHFTRQ